MKKEKTNTNVSRVGATIGRLHSKGMDKKQNGITLIALIITIIVMLILVGVTVTVALNGGLFSTAKEAAKETQIEADREILQSAVVASIGKGGELDSTKILSNLPTGWTGSDRTYTSPKGNIFTVNSKGEITIGNSGGETAEIPEELKRYILGADLTGRSIMDICDFLSFLDDELTEEDETETVPIKFLINGLNGDSTERYVYGKYNNVAYKIACDFSNGLPNRTLPEGIEVIYTPTGREGQDLGTVTGNSKYDGWTIIYDNGDSVEAVAPFTSDEGLRLGSGNLDDAIASYNDAITSINNYVKAETTKYGGKKITEYTQDGTTNGVRSVGAAVDPTGEDDTYSSTNLENWNSAYNGVGKIGDMAYEQDIVRMSYYNCLNLGKAYWVASRSIDTSDVEFLVWSVADEGHFARDSLWYVHDTGSAGSAGSYPYAVRPIISIQNP